jgi:hypothetical protein
MRRYKKLVFCSRKANLLAVIPNFTIDLLFLALIKEMLITITKLKGAYHG